MKSKFPVISWVFLKLSSEASCDINKTHQKSLSKIQRQEHKTEIFSGNPIENARAPYSGKYWLWHELWPSQFKPPSYCNGQCALLTSEAVSKIYSAAKTTNRNNFRLEDFFYVGIMRMKAGIPNPSPFIFKNTTEGSRFQSACYHMADVARYETLMDTYYRLTKGTLRIYAGAWLTYLYS